MRNRPSNSVWALFVLVLTAFAVPTVAQDVPWDAFEDPLTGRVCGVVNAANAELVVHDDTGQLIIVTGSDVILLDTVVTLENDVFYEGLPAGFIGFDEDEDGSATVWWLSLTGNVVSVNSFTGEPTDSNLFPADFSGVPCDACEFWDDQTVCDDPDDPSPPPNVTISFCGTNASLAMGLSFAGLATMSLVRRRRYR